MTAVGLAAKAGFARDLYRLGVHLIGRGFIAMSSDCVVHAYDENLKPLFETGLAEVSELQPLRGRFAIGDGQLKNHIPLHCALAGQPTLPVHGGRRSRSQVKIEPSHGPNAGRGYLRRITNASNSRQSRDSKSPDGSNLPPSANHIWTPPACKGDCRRDLELSCSHISGLLVGLEMKPRP
jgi:hypothetical protein